MTRGDRNAAAIRAASLATAFACLGACNGKEGTLDISLVTAPGRNLDAVQTLRVTVTNPMRLQEITRSSSGFDLDLDLDASGEQASILVDGLDASGNIVDVGASPTFPLGPLDGRIRIYMAPPNSIAAAPPVIDPARAEMGVGQLTYGAILVGGATADGAASDVLQIYNGYDHSLVAGLPLPAPRIAPIVGVGARGIVYIFGGKTDTPASNLWRFDTSVAPAGAFNDFGEKMGFARASETAVSLGNDELVITGAPPAQLFGLSGMLVEKTDVASLPPGATSLIASDGATTAIFVGPDGVTKLRNNVFSTLTVDRAARPDPSVITLPNARVGVFCGDVVRIDPVAGTGELVEAAEPRTGCAAASTGKYVVVAGGTTAAGVVTTADIYDAMTLTRVATQPLVVPRTDADAVALSNGQILIAGGRDASGQPIATLELFTPQN
jgi:hypothetical protein